MSFCYIKKCRNRRDSKARKRKNLLINSDLTNKLTKLVPFRVLLSQCNENNSADRICFALMPSLTNIISTLEVRNNVIVCRVAYMCFSEAVSVKQNRLQQSNVSADFAVLRTVNELVFATLLSLRALKKPVHA